LQDFHAYLDVARTLWQLDDDRLKKISSSETATDAFREIAAYVGELRHGLDGQSPDEMKALEADALEKVATKLAGRADITAIQKIPQEP
jgi:hypothetical protein